MSKKILIIIVSILSGFYSTRSFGQCMTSLTLSGVKDVSCNGGGDGEITVTVGGGKAPFTYEIYIIDGGGEIPLGSIAGSMSNTVTFGVAYGNIDDPINGLSAFENYRIRVTSSETNLTPGCKVRTLSGIDISEPSLIELSADSQPDCGSNSGSINLIVTGGSPGFTYRWTGPTTIGNVANPSGLAAGNYTVIVSDNENCSETLSNIIVEAGPDVTIASVAPVCLNDGSFNLSAVTAGGTWSGTGITDAGLGTFSPAVAGSGSWVITYTLTANGCTKSDTETIEVKLTPDATINSSGPFCITGSPVNINSATTGGTWSGQGITNASLGTFDPATAGEGTHTITYEVTVNGCTSIDTETFIVNPLPDASIIPAGPFCSNVIAVNLSAATSGGTWSGTGITDASAGTFNPTTAGPGSHIISYEVAINGCTSTDTETIVVRLAPDATITPTGPVCLNAASFNLSAATTGGTWSGAGITNASAGTFNAASAGAGSHTITYEVTINDCTSSDTKVIEVTPVPDATITPAGPFCANGNSNNLSAATTGGTWSGAGIIDASAGTFDPASAGPGSHIITYEMTLNGCTVTDSETFVVNPEPDATIEPISPICANTAKFNLTSTTPGGSWSGSGITDPSTGVFNPELAGPGSHTITYEITVNGCTSTETEIIEVLPLPDAAINPAGPFCTNSTEVNLSAVTSGGTWSGPGITNSSTGTFNPVIAGPGSHTITYEVTVNGCTSTDTEIIVVNPEPDAAITSTGPFCINEASLDLIAATSGGSWSGPGITNASAGTFDPSIAGIGYHIITYELTINGCTNTNTETIEVKMAPDAAISPVNSICVDATLFNFTAATAGGIWSGFGITDASAGTFDPAIAGPGSHEITYEITIGGCTSTDTEIIEIKPIPDATITPVHPVCINTASFNFTAATTGGSWSGLGITDASLGTFNPAIAGEGAHTITYEITIDGCSSVATETIEVTPLPEATIDPVASLCVNDDVITLSAATPGGVWSGTGIVDVNAGTFDPSLSGAGSWTITYIVNINGCISNDTETIIVSPSPEAPEAEISTQICINTTADNLSAAGTDLRWYSDQNLTTQIGSGEDLDPSPYIDNSVAGNFTFFVTQTVSGCESPATAVTLQIIDSQPDPPIVSDVVICINNDAELTATGSDLEWYSDEQLTDLIGTGESFQPDPLIFDNTMIGSFTFYVTQSLAGCGKSEGAAIVLNYIDDSPTEAPVASLESEITCDSFEVEWTAVGGIGYRYDLSEQPDFSSFVLQNEAVAGTDIKTTFHNLNAGTTYFFRVRSENSCGMGPKSNVVNVTLPEISEKPLAASPEPICLNEEIPVINVPGNNIMWYSDEALTELIFSGNSFQPTGLIDNSVAGMTTFYVTQTSGTCTESEALELTINYINDISCPQDCELSNLNISLNSITHATCFAPTSGAATIAASGGAVPYSFSWFNSDNDMIDNTATISNLPEGNYLAIVTDNLGCTKNLPIYIYESLLLTTNITPQTNCDPDGAITLLVEGGSGDYIYQWSNPDGFQSASANISHLEAGVYDLTVLDLSTFCSKELSGVVVENNVSGNCDSNGCEESSVAASVSDVENASCSGEGTGSIRIQASGSTTRNYFYSLDAGLNWVSFAPGEKLDDLSPGLHNLVVGDEEMDSCPVIIEFNITEPTGDLTASLRNSTVSFPDQPSGSISIDQISGGTSPYRSKISLKAPSFPDQQLDIGWNNVSMNTNTLEYELHYNNLYAGKYEVTIQDDNGCEIIIEVDLDFDRNILIPNVFTPNGDGYNDIFYIRNLPEVGTKIVVTNKWGKTVFESNDYRNNWTGGDVPEGVYYYNMVTNVGTKYNGWIEIWRGPAF